jgi:selenocysteine-specific elongation factor
MSPEPLEKKRDTTEKDHVIVGTAGHIDHGKSALVKALTGRDPDTLPEEKERGMTIELGFIFLDDPGYEKQIVFIDVPGHEKFVKTMAAGASNVDAALFVIAADEGISVQTREHFDILQLMGIKRGAIALTKADLVDEAGIAGLTAAVRSFVRGSFLEDVPILPVSSVTGEGVDKLKNVLLEIGRRTEARPDNGIFRMPIDRVFTMRGFGTVVAGTVLGGEIRAGDRIAVYPEGIESRIRGIQVHGAKKDFSKVGKRTALNLQDLKKEDLRRGQVAAAPGSLVPTTRLDARLETLRSSEREIKHRERVRLHIGTDEVISRLVLLEGARIRPGGSALVQFVLESPTVALPGDRFVIRSFSPLMTIGGGVVLDAAPVRHKRFSAPALEGLGKLAGETKDVVEQMFIQSPTEALGIGEIALKSGKSEAEVEKAVEGLVLEAKLVRAGEDRPELYVHRDVLSHLTEFVDEFVREYFNKNPQRLLMPFSDLRSEYLKRGDPRTLKDVIDGLVGRNVLTRKEGQIGLTGREAVGDPEEREAASRVEDVYRRARFATPLEEEVRSKLGLNPSLFRAVVRNLIRVGRLVRLGKKVTYHSESYEEARRIVLGHIERRGSVTIAELRDRLSLSRKYAQAILEHFDEIGLTRRTEDRHVLVRS